MPRCIYVHTMNKKIPCPATELGTRENVPRICEELCGASIEDPAALHQPGQEGIDI